MGTQMQPCDYGGACLESGQLALAAADRHGESVESSLVASSPPVRLLPFVELLAGQLENCLQGIGLALDGTVSDDRHSLAVFPMRPEWQGAPIADMLMHRVNVPVALATLAEAGALVHARRANLEGVLLYLLVARTVTAAITDGDHLAVSTPDLRQQLNGIGHHPVVSHGRLCSCGARGHVNTVASAQAIVRDYIGLASGSDDANAVMQHASHGRAEALSAAKIVLLADAGDPTAEAVVAPAMGALARSIAYLLQITNARYVVIAGPLASAAEAVTTRLHRLLVKAIPATLEVAAFSATTGAQGAALLSREVEWRGR